MGTQRRSAEGWEERYGERWGQTGHCQPRRAPRRPLERVAGYPFSSPDRSAAEAEPRERRCIGDDERVTIAGFLGIDSPETSAALVAVVVAFLTALATSPVKYAFDKRLQIAKAKLDYEFDERAKLREKIGSYHGRLLEAAISLNYRLGQIYSKRDEHWLEVDGDYTKRWPRHYFFNSTIYRFMAFVALANRFEREAIYIDSRIADDTDRLFLYYVKALRWTLTDTQLFDGLPYGNEPTDHFYTDHLRRMCAGVWKEDGDGLLDLRAFEDHLDSDHELDEVLKFFDGLDPSDTSRPRWDRLVAFQMVLMGFIENFGYEIHQTEQRWFDAVARRMRREVATNLLDWLPKLGIGTAGKTDPGGKNIVAALRSVELPGHSNTLRTQASLPASTDPQA